MCLRFFLKKSVLKLSDRTVYVWNIKACLYIYSKFFMKFGNLWRHLYNYWWDLRSSGTLRSVDWQLVTGVSGQPFGLILKGRIVCPEMSVPYYQSTLRKLPEERRSHLLRGRTHKSHVVLLYGVWLRVVWSVGCYETSVLTYQNSRTSHFRRRHSLIMKCDYPRFVHYIARRAKLNWDGSCWCGTPL
jgi:hypothetical protein